MHHWPTAGCMVPNTDTARRTISPKNCSPRQPAEPYSRGAGIFSGLDHPRDEPEPVPRGKREHGSKHCELAEKDLPVECREQTSDRSDQEPAVDQARDDECGH